MKQKEHSSNISSDFHPKHASISNPKILGVGIILGVGVIMGFGMIKCRGVMKQLMSNLDSGSMKPKTMMQTMMGMCSARSHDNNNTEWMVSGPATELQTLFCEWLEKMEYDALEVLNQQSEIGVAKLAAVLNIADESAIQLVAHLANKRKVVLSIRAFDAIENTANIQ